MASSVDVKQTTLKGMLKSGRGSGATTPPPLYRCRSQQSDLSRCSSGAWLAAAGRLLLLLPLLLVALQAGGSRVASAGGMSTPREASGALSNTPTKAARYGRLSVTSCHPALPSVLLLLLLQLGSRSSSSTTVVRSGRESTACQTSSALPGCRACHRAARGAQWGCEHKMRQASRPPSTPPSAARAQRQRRRQQAGQPAVAGCHPPCY